MSGKILPYVLSAGVGLGSYGCATINNLAQQAQEHVQHIGVYRGRSEKQENIANPWAVSTSEMRRLGVSNNTEVRIWPGGFKSDKKR